MGIAVKRGDLVYQHPLDRVAWSVEGVPDPTGVRVRRVRPGGDGQELTATVEDGAVLVAGGFNGARYELTLADGASFQVRVTTIGVESVDVPNGHPKHAVATVVKALQRGRVLVPVNGAYQVRELV